MSRYVKQEGERVSPSTDPSRVQMVPLVQRVTFGSIDTQKVEKADPAPGEICKLLRHVVSLWVL